MQLEEQFWKGNSAFYRETLADDVVMVFAPPVGVLTKETIVETIASGPRWQSVEFADVRLLTGTDEVVALVYRGLRAERSTIRLFRVGTSIYVARGGAWKLIIHQQTPADVPA